MNENTNPNAIARELLKIDTSAIGGSIIVDGVDVLETTRNAQKVARAVIELTAKVKRVEALAETWEEAARLVEARGGDVETVRDILQDVRAALNGDNHE